MACMVYVCPICGESIVNYVDLQVLCPSCGEETKMDPYYDEEN